MQSNFHNQKPNIFGLKLNKGLTTYFAKEGEPMYMKAMDSDEDGMVSLDEFKSYCEENGISPKDMVKLAEIANSYRTMQGQKKAEKAVQGEDEDNSVSGMVYAKRGDAKYDELMDVNSDDKVTYQEYIEYCKEHSNPQEQKSDTKIEETADGKFETKSMSKAVNAYSSAEYEQVPGMYELVA